MLFPQDPESDILFPMKTPFDSPICSPERLSLVRRTITPHLTEDEHELFILACERSGLDPLARHIYPVKRREYNQHTRTFEETYRPEATIDGLRLTAERTNKYAGQLGPEWCGSDGIWKDIWLVSEPPAAARVGILRSDFKEPVWGKALYSEFVQLVNGEPAPFWAKMAANQLAKCAEALGFRKSFPLEFSSIYTRDEMAQAEQLRVELSASGCTPSADPICNSDNPEHESGSLSAGRSVPVPLRAFVNRGTGDRKNVTAAMNFLEHELIQVAGLNGSAIFKTITNRLPRTYRTREECHAAVVGCWLELWAEIEKLRQERAA